MALFCHCLMAALAWADPGETGWSREPSLPDPIGYAGMVAGMSGDTLLAAGGARFPTRPPWEGGSKVYEDSIWLLPAGSSSWVKSRQRLPAPLAYGVSATWRDTVVVAGGETRAGEKPISCVPTVWTIAPGNDGLDFTPLPSLPSPVAYAAGTVVGDRLIVAGGVMAPAATKALNAVWMLELSHPSKGWKKLPEFPGAGRILATCAAIGSDFFLMGGAEILPDGEGKPARRYLKDAWRLDASGTWHRLPDMPVPIAAAATPAPVENNHIWIISGDDGTLAGTKPSDHPGFPAHSLAFDSVKNMWRTGPRVPAPRVTLPTVLAKKRWWFISGESRPGIRSPEVWSAEPARWKWP
ncbi:MAG: hypothetical protein FJ261_02600 [Planctomycetes bacterium]|nr:hypothetical protein [Planctomycetota bacterium]